MSTPLKTRPESARVREAQIGAVRVGDDKEFLELLGARVRSARDDLALSRKQVLELVASLFDVVRCLDGLLSKGL